MVSSGADAKGVEAALKGVRRVSWAAGRTFRPKYVVLLAFAEVKYSTGTDPEEICFRVDFRAVIVAVW